MVNSISRIVDFDISEIILSRLTITKNPRNFPKKLQESDPRPKDKPLSFKI